MNTDDVQSKPQLDAASAVPTPEISTTVPEKAPEPSDLHLQQLTADLQPDAAPEVPTPEVPPIWPPKAPKLSGIDVRLKQIGEYRDYATQYRNRLSANIRRADSDLMQVGALLADRLIEVLKPGPQSDDDAEQICGSVDLLLRVSDQIGRLGDLEMRLNKEDRQNDPFRLF